MIAVILAGGKGTRLGEIAKNLPKPLVPIQDKPVLLHQLENLKKNGFRHIVFLVGYKGEKIREFFGDGSRFGVKIEYHQEEYPLGTAGALYYIKEKVSDDFLLIYGDLIFDLDLRRFIDFHHRVNGLCTLMVHPNDHPADSDIMVLDEKNRVTKILRKNEPRTEYYTNSVNAGILLFKKQVLGRLQKDKKQDLEEDLILPLIHNGGVYGYKTSEYIKDMGTPERYRKVQNHLLEGIITQRSLKNQQKAIFLDRDGTINKHVGFVSCCKDLEIMEEAYSAIGMINNSKYLAIVITNQSVVARNLCSLNELREIHNKMEVELGQRSVYIDDLFFCPHHPDKGYPDENVLYKADCSCRKPKIGLILQAVEKYHIDLSASYFIGDSITDVLTGKNAGVKTIFLGQSEFFHDAVVPDYCAKNLLEAVKIIIGRGA